VSRGETALAAPPLHGLRVPLVAFVVVLVGCAASGARGSGHSPAPPTATKNDSPIPTDPNLLDGTLDNGLSYYLRRDRLPSGGAYVGLVVKAGLANEGDGQQGLAHLVQHVAFGGTPRFEKERLAEALHRLGLQPAPDQHVVTSVDVSVYGLALPASAGHAMPAALELLGAWSSAIAFEPARVERERRAVLDEIHAGGPEQQLAKQTLDVLLRGSASAARLSSATEGVVAKATPEQLLGFHQAWYRPDRMAIVAVGDLDPRQVEHAIRERFGRIKGSGPAPAAAAPLVPLNHETSFVTLPAQQREESEESDEDDEPEDRPPPIPTLVSIAFKRPRSPIRTEADLRQSVIATVYGQLVQARLDKLAQRSGSPLMAAQWFSVPRLPLQLAVAQASVKPWRLEAGLQALWTELHAIARQGFEPSELAVALEVLKPPSPAVRAGGVEIRDETTYAQRMTEHFLYGDALPSVEVMRDLEQKLLSDLRLAEINDYARSLPNDAARVVLASGPKDQLGPEEALRAAVTRAESPERRSAVPQAIAGALVDVAPKPGAVVREVAIDEIGVTVWTLSNDATVVIKPTRFKPDEVLFQACAAGGTSLASDRDYWSASLAPEIVTAGGLGRHEPEELGRLLAGRSAEAHPWIAETEQGMQAKAAPEDLELMLQLVYLGFTAPRADPESFEDVQENLRAQLRARDADPNRAFGELLRQQSFGNHPRRRPASAKSIGQLRLAVALDFYRRRFSQASDFTFVLVGDIDKDRLKPLVERYLASLPNTERKDGQGQKGRWRDVGARLANGVQRIRVARGEGDTSTVTMTFHREAAWSREAETALEALRGTLEIRVREALAGRPLAARSLSVTAALERTPIAQSTLTLSFDSPRAGVDESKRAVLRVIQDAKGSPARPSDVAAVRDARKEYLERAWETNAFWLAALTEQYRFGSDPRDIQKLRTSADQIDAPMIERAARDDLDLNRYIEAVRSPRRK
jgi:zinc protease